MFKRKEKAFTLIELIAVLVIMAIIALIATPLVMNIIRKARISSDRRSVDAYGRSIELAIAGYLLDTGKFPTEVSQLTIEYSGSQVVCSTTQINPDSSVYLAGCTVAGRSIGDYKYGSDKSPSYTAYTVGDQVTYNNVDYYVIKDSGAKESSVTLLKAEPLSYEEIASILSENDVYNRDGYGVVPYGADNYSTSIVKTVVEKWGLENVPIGLQEVRLIKIEDLTNNLGYKAVQQCTGSCYEVISKTDETPIWVYDGSSDAYWTMSINDDSSYLATVSKSGYVVYTNRTSTYFVRPVITISKSALSS